MTENRPPGDEASRALERGVDALADGARTTLGPHGRDFVLPGQRGAPTEESFGDPESQDPYELLGTELVRAAAARAREATGAGAATTVVLSQALVREALRAAEQGADPLGLSRGISQAAEAVGQEIAVHARPVETREQLAAVVATAMFGLPPGDPTDPPEFPDDESSLVGRVVAEALDKVGTEGEIVVEAQQAPGPMLRFTEGLRFRRGYLSPYFVSDYVRSEAVLDNPYILLTDLEISSVAELRPLLELIVEDRRPVLIVAGDVTGEALGTLVVNKIRGHLQVAAVKAPGAGDHRRALLGDLAVVTGAEVVSTDLSAASRTVLGTARRVVVTNESTTVTDGSGDRDRIRRRMRQLQAELDATEVDWNRTRLAERLANLSAGVAVITVAGGTAAEVGERRRQVEDAVRVARVALAKGVVAGGGAGLLHAGTAALDRLRLEGDEALGAQIVRRTLEIPLRQIAENAGLDGTGVVERLRELTAGHGLDARTGQYVDLVAAGIVDPAEVVRAALRNAAEVAGLLLNAEEATADLPERAQPDVATAEE